MFNFLIFLPFLIQSDQIFDRVSIWSGNGTEYISQETTENIIKIKHIGKSSYAITGQPYYQPVEFGDVFQISVDVKILSIS